MTGKETNAEYLRRLRAQAVSNGLCQECRSRTPSDGLRTCSTCLGARSKREASNRSAGLCGCGAAPEFGMKTCQRCLQYNRDTAARKRRRHLALGMCPYCTRQLDPGYQACRKHLDQIAKNSRIAHARRRSATP